MRCRRFTGETPGLELQTSRQPPSGGTALPTGSGATAHCGPSLRLSIKQVTPQSLPLNPVHASNISLQGRTPLSTLRNAIIVAVIPLDPLRMVLFVVGTAPVDAATQSAVSVFVKILVWAGHSPRRNRGFD